MSVVNEGRGCEREWFFGWFISVSSFAARGCRGLSRRRRSQGQKTRTKARRQRLWSEPRLKYRVTGGSRYGRGRPPACVVVGAWMGPSGRGGARLRPPRADASLSPAHDGPSRRPRTGHDRPSRPESVPPLTRVVVMPFVCGQTLLLLLRETKETHVWDDGDSNLLSSLNITRSEGGYLNTILHWLRSNF